MSKYSFPLAALLGLAVLAGSLPGRASDGPALEEIIVTAHFRDTALMETIGSVSVVPESTISERAAQHLQDILNAAPNVTWAGGASRSKFVQIRGIGDLEQFYDPKYYPSVGIMLDNLELGDSANAGMLFDIGQVEVLRGPQGTRFGASGHAGMVYMRSNAPTEEFEGEVSGGAGNKDSYNLGTVLSGPFSENVSGRIAVQQNHSDGYMDNRHRRDSDTNDFDEFTSRGQLRWGPTDTAEYRLNAMYFDSDNGYDAYSLDNDRKTQTDQPGKDKQELVTVNAVGYWEVGNAHSLEASLGYLDADLEQRYDSDWVSDALCNPLTCSDGNDTSQEMFDRDRDRWTADVRLLSGNDPGKGSGNYVLGLYANDSDDDLDYQNLSLWYGNFTTRSEYENERYAAYGEYEYGLTDALTLVAGARVERYDDDYKDSNGFSSDNDETLWGGELSARYALNDTSMAYLTVARSQKPGGVNTSASANQPFMSPDFQAFTSGKLNFDDETLVNFETGFRTEQLDGRLSLNAALFYTRRDNAQLENWMWDGAAGLWISFLDTSSDVDSYGAELETVFLVNNRVELFARLGWLDTEVDSIEAFDLDQLDFVKKNNRDQAKSPDYQYNIGTRVSIGDQLSGRLEVEGQDSSYFGYYHDGKLGSYNLLNASVQWQSDAFTVTVWGRNLTDENYAVHGLYFAADPRDDFGAWANMTYEQLGEPRVYGVEMRYRF